MLISKANVLLNFVVGEQFHNFVLTLVNQFDNSFLLFFILFALVLISIRFVDEHFAETFTVLFVLDFFALFKLLEALVNRSGHRSV